jgi:dienelactone hydrolase
MRCTPSTRSLVALGLLSLLLVPAARAGEPAECRKTTAAFDSGGKTIAVERIAPPEEGKYPAVVMLHAIDGLDNRFGDLYRSVAETLARKGYAVQLVHYFDRTGAAAEDVAGYRKRFLPYVTQGAGDEEWKALRQLFHAWVDTVGDAVADARRQPDVDGERVALVGVSLGGFLATAAAAQPGLNVAAVVECCGGLPDEYAEGLRLPPTLIFHGDKDGTVPVKEAYALCGRLRARNLPVDVKVYEGVGHVFAKGDRGFDLRAAWDAQQRTLRFLDENLKARGDGSRGK